MTDRTTDTTTSATHVPIEELRAMTAERDEFRELYRTWKGRAEAAEAEKDLVLVRLRRWAEHR